MRVPLLVVTAVPLVAGVTLGFVALRCAALRVRARWPGAGDDDG
ncbi:hypothetical protein [Pseudonocardia acidicola]|nr:hypothetical protein [Pseudonocardia acidicola]